MCIRDSFWNAGHILGSASAEIEIGSEGSSIKLLCSGDIGPDNKEFYPDPAAPHGLDYVVCESTYGNRSREDVSIEPVSYTHLDVYKRQAPAPRWCWR